MKPKDIIKNSRLITDIYGKWPDFHDFEIVKVVFERNLENDEFGPFIIAFVHMWEITGKTPDGSKFIFAKHNVAQLRCNNVLEHEFKGFNNQNAIDDIEISEEEDEGNNKVISVHFPSLYGADIFVKCHSIEVLSIEQGLPWFSVYADKT